jgi:oxalate decarboxylase/phosphoglucose isomerase-like protein (cupin superfamily)
MKTIALLLLSTALTTWAQTASSTVKAEIEPQMRAAFNTSAFQYKFNPVASLASNQFGSIQTMFANDVPSLDTLPGNGLAQAVINLNSCAIWNPHTHPRANEILYVAAGNVKMGFQEENKGTYGPDFGDQAGQTYGGRLFNFSAVPQGSSVIVPQALSHYIWNPNCEQAVIVSSFDSKDPGVSSQVQSLFAFPQEVITAATGLDAITLSLVQALLAKQPLVSFDQACLTRCKLPIPSQVAAVGADTPATPASQAPSTDTAGRRML